MGVFQVTNNNFQVGLAPVIGVLIPVGDVDLTANIRHNMAVRTNDAIFNSYLGFNIGVAFGG